VGWNKLITSIQVWPWCRNEDVVSVKTIQYVVSAEREKEIIE
jgi:hypothetical protein